MSIGRVRHVDRQEWRVGRVRHVDRQEWRVGRVRPVDRQGSRGSHIHTCRLLCLHAQTVAHLSHLKTAVASVLKFTPLLRNKRFFQRAGLGRAAVGHA